MKSLFPERSDLNYERMALAVTMAVIFVLMGLVFSSDVLREADAISEIEMWSLPPSVVVLRLWALVLTASAMFSMGAAFVCFTLTKISPRHFSRFYTLRLRIRYIGLVCVVIALFLGGLWIAINVALRFSI